MKILVLSIFCMAIMLLLVVECEGVRGGPRGGGGGGMQSRGSSRSSRGGGQIGSRAGKQYGSSHGGQNGGKHGGGGGGAQAIFGNHRLAGNVVNVLGFVNPSFRPIGYRAANAANRAQLGLPV
jgi:hypothetical protein